jgi:hypothetical protein
MNLSRPLLVLLTGLTACSSSGGDEQCDTFKEPAPLAPVTIHVTNKRATSIYTDSCVGRFRVAVDGEMQEGELPWWMNITCEAARTDDWYVGGCESGPVPLEAGASFDVHWPGLSYTSTTMPEGCYSDKGKASREALNLSPAYPCFQGHAVAPGPTEVVFHFQATGEGSPFDVTQTLDLASGATLNVDVN